MKKSQAIIIPTALFVAMFVLLLSTMLVASVSQNLKLSLDNVQSTEFRYLSFGAANDLLSQLNAGLDVRRYTASNPLRTQSGGQTTDCWVEPLTGKNVLVVAQTYSARQSRPEVVKRLAVYKDFPLARVYTNVTDGDTSRPDPIYFSDVSATGAWSRLPDFPKSRYTAAGTLEYKPGEKANTLPFMAGGADGSMYAVYAPALDGWDDESSPAWFAGIPFPVALPWGQITVNTLVAGGRQGLTIGDLAPVAQVLVNNLLDVSVSKGAVMMKFDHTSGEWTPLPAPEEVKVVNGDLQVQTGNYHVQGGPGPPATYAGGVMAPMFRKGQDTIYRFTEETQAWTYFKPPGTDVLLLAGDDKGNPFVQTGTIHPSPLDYFLRVLLGDLHDIEPIVTGTALHQMVDGQWVSVPNPPARFFTKAGQLQDSAYSSSRGPVFGGMAGGENGEFFVVNRPSRPGLVDTIYKLRGGKWEVVPSPPNKSFDPVTGQAHDEEGLPSRLEIGFGTGGKLLLRIPTTDGPNPIFQQTEGGGYDLLPLVRDEGASPQKWLSQISGGRKRQGDMGAFVVRATYF